MIGKMIYINMYLKKNKNNQKLISLFFVNIKCQPKMKLSTSFARLTASVFATLHSAADFLEMMIRDYVL